MKVANNLPQQVQVWVEQARKTDQTAGDKDQRPDSIDWSGSAIDNGQDHQYLPGPPKGLELAKEILTSKNDLAVIGGATVLGTVSGLLTSALLPGLGAANGALFGAGFGAFCGTMFSIQERAYGI